MKYYVDIDLKQNQLKNARIHSLTSAPTSPVESQVYYNSSSKNLELFNGSAWSILASKEYVDTLKQGLDPKDSVRAATTTNIDLATGGLLVIDGVQLNENDRVLVKDQTNASENGIYLASSGAWVRAEDCDSSEDVTSGMYFFVTEGNDNGSGGFVLTTPDPITLGTTDLIFVRFSGAGQIIAGAGLIKNGNTLDVVSSEGVSGSVGTLTITGDMEQWQC